MGSSRSQTAEFRARCGFCYQAKFSWGEEVKCRNSGRWLRQPVTAAIAEC